MTRGLTTYFDIPDDHGISIRVQKVLSLGVTSQHDRLSPLRTGQRSVYVLCNERQIAHPLM